MAPVRVAVAGAGLIGRRHIEEVDASGDARLAAIVDPGPAGPELAEKFGVPLYRSLGELFERDKPDGVILATPNQMHVDGGLRCVGVPVLTGHHRTFSGTRSWWEPFDTSTESIDRSDPLANRL